MRDAVEIIARLPKRPAAPPVAPWDYIRLRREAAGLSIAQVADRLTPSGEQRARTEEELRAFEIPGVRVKNIDQVRLVRAFPFSAGIYRQLAFLPAAQHPRVCRGCGWDRWTQQVDVHGNECGFSADHVDRCTACAVIEARGLRRRAG